MRMRSKQIYLACLGVAAFAVATIAEVSSNSRDRAHAADATAAAQDRSADEKTIRAAADEFVKAFNAGDAKTIGAQWATDAIYTDEAGEQFHGREAIEQQFAELFKAHPGATITLFIDSIRFLGPNIAAERGIARVKMPNDGPTTAARYRLVHARRDGKWVIAVGRDAPYVSEFDDDHLKELAWLIGVWKPDGKDTRLRINFEWMAQRHFIKNTFTTAQGSQATLAGGQIIGWNPKLDRIVSWHFDPQGGFGNDVWTKEGESWVIDATGTLRDGSDSAAVNTITPIDANSFTWQSTDRTLDGVSLPDTGPIKMVRVEAEKKP